jgi:triacylglycerol lipase
VCVVAVAAVAAGCAGDLAGAADGGAAADATAPDDATAGPARVDADPAGPPYPLVLVHGMAGFHNIGPLDYFYGIIAALQHDGHDVWVSQQDPINDSEVRGAQLQTFVQSVLFATGKRRVDLICHSQGGFDCRYVASRMGERIGAVVTIASPMLGDPLADLVVKSLPGAQAALDALLNLYGAVAGYDSNAQAQIAMLASDGAAAFFARHPDDERVAYFSIAGRSEGTRGDPDCLGPRVAPFVARWDDQLDTLNPLLGPAAALLDGLVPRPVHDGLVPVASARHGTFLGCIPADHLDEVNQIAGNAPGPNNRFDVVRFYRDLADFLVERGF